MPAVTPDDVKNLISKAFRSLDNILIQDCSLPVITDNPVGINAPENALKCCESSPNMECLSVHSSIKRAYPWISYGFAPGRTEPAGSSHHEMCSVCHNYDKVNGCMCPFRKGGTCCSSDDRCARTCVLPESGIAF